MSSNLLKVLDHIGTTYQAMIDETSRHYIEISVGRAAGELGYPDVQHQYENNYVVIPIKTPVPGMKVRIDGRTFVNYCKHPSGFAVPGYIAKAAGMPCKVFLPNDSMILNVA